MRVNTLGFAVSLCFCSCAFAQEFRATLSGRITDPASAVITEAKVTVKNADTGETVSVLTGDDGSYQVSFLIPGNYVVTVQKPGFQQVIREGVRLQVAQRAVVDVQLTIGTVDQSVTVTGGAEVLETESADRGLTIEPSRVLDMPLQGRNPFAAAWSAPGVIENAAAQRLRPFDIAGSSSLVINGGRPSTNELLVDGISSLYEATAASYIPTASCTRCHSGRASRSARRSPDLRAGRSAAGR